MCTLVKDIKTNIFKQAFDTNTLSNINKLNSEAMDFMFKQRYESLKLAKKEEEIPNIITNLFLINKYKYEGLIESLFIDYVINDNTRLTETYTETLTKNVTNDNDGTITNTGTVSNNINGSNINSTTTYEDNNYNNAEKNETTEKSTRTDNTIQKDTSLNTTEEISNNTHKYERSGSIGVITNQDMIKKEREIRMYCIYDTIIEDVSQTILLQIY